MSTYRCALPNAHLFRAKDDGLPTQSFKEQVQVEDIVERCYEYFKSRLEIESDIPELHRLRHEIFLTKGLQHLSESYECLDASRPWLCYWILHSMFLLDIPITDDIGSKVVNFLTHCQQPTGGFAGGPDQHSHLAPTYAAVNALCIIGTDEAYQCIDRKTLYDFLMSMRSIEGGFKLHEDGELDIRGVYCAASVARLMNIATPQLFESTHDWISSCQTYEGGYGGCPGMEAHGGYSFCGLAALILLSKEKYCDVKSLLRWTAFKQMSFEGGFQGRTNKLVDGCYSFWQGGAFPLVHMVLSKEGDEGLSAENWMFDQGALQEYLLLCCQHTGGGLLDKPNKSRDYYHTCYCLSGLSVAQHFMEGCLSKQHIIGCPDNAVKPTHCLFNIGILATENAHRHFGAMPVPCTDKPHPDV